MSVAEKLSVLLIGSVLVLAVLVDGELQKVLAVFGALAGAVAVTLLVGSRRAP